MCSNSFIIELISESDLESITVKGIRKKIEEEDSKDYSSEKVFFNETINNCLTTKLEKTSLEESKTAQNNSNEDGDFLIAQKLQKEEEAKSVHRPTLRRRAAGTNRKYQENLIITSSKNKPPTSADSSGEKSKKRVLNKPCILSPEMAAVFDNEFTELPRPEVVKKLWDYIKRKNLQDKNDRRYILCDKKLLAVFGKPRINCFKMAKYMSAHVRKKEDLSSSRVSVVSLKLEPSSSAAATSKTNSPKRLRISNEMVEDSDEEAEVYLQSNTSLTEDTGLNQLLLSVPGVKRGMSYSAVQAAVLAYTQVKKLRNNDNPDMIKIKEDAIMRRLMNTQSSDDDVHILDLIQRVQFLFENENEK